MPETTKRTLPRLARPSPPKKRPSPSPKKPAKRRRSSVSPQKGPTIADYFRRPPKGPPDEASAAAMAAAPAVTFQTTINKLAGALEGGLNELLVAIWQAIMLKKPFLTAKVFLGAYLLSWLGARLDAFQILWTAVVTLFTLPKLWSLRSRELDEKLAVVRVHHHRERRPYERADLIAVLVVATRLHLDRQ